MADTLESLEIEVKHSATGAAGEIGKVADAVERLSKALNGVPTKMKNLVSVMNAIKGNATININDSSTHQTAETINNVQQAAQRAGRATSEVAKGIKSLSKEAAKSKSPLDTFISSLKRIAMYRVLRSIIKAITQAFKEGLENAYFFSRGIEGEGHRFATAMDSMKTAGTTMKNQLGSAFIALLTAIAPVVNAIIGLITKLANALSQLFAVFTGGTYLKAAEVPQQYAKAAGGAAQKTKEWKNQLMGFDEINKLEAPSDGGGGSGGGTDPMSMFNDTPIDGIFAKIKAKIDELKNSLNFEPLIKAWDHLKEAVKGFADVVLQYLAAAWDKILVPLAHWVIEEAAPRLVELLAKAFEFLAAILERLQPVFDWVWEHVLKPIAEFVGDAFVKFLDTVIDLLGKLTDLISGKTTFKDFLDSLTPGQAILLALATAFIVVNGVIAIFTAVSTIATTVVGLLSVAFTALTSPIGLVILAIAALIAAGIALYQNWDEIVNFFKTEFSRNTELMRADWERTKEFFRSTAESIKQGFADIGKAIAAPFKEGAAEIRADIERTKAFFQNMAASVKSIFDGLRNAIHNVFAGIRNTVSNILNSIMSMIQRVANAIHNLFSSIGSFGGMFNISGFVPKYASGGFPEDGLFFANHNELVGQFSNGKTAVANNQEIVEGIKQGVIDAMLTVGSTQGGGRNTEFVFQLNGKDFARAIYNDQQAVSRERGQRLVKSYGGY